LLYIWSNAEQKLIHTTVGQYVHADGIPYEVIPLDYNLTQVETGDTVLVMGAKGVERLSEAGIAPKGRAIGSLRGKRLQAEEDSPNFLVTYDPNITKREAPKSCEIRWDSRLASRLERTGTTRPKTGDYQWATSLDSMVESIQERYAKTERPVRLAWDLETMGLYPWYVKKHIITSQWTIDIGHSLVVDHRVASGSGSDLTPNMREGLEFLLRSPMVNCWGANLKFDVQWVRQKWGILCTRWTFDTVVAGSLLDENRSNSLNTHAKEYTAMGGYDDEFNDSIDKSKMEEVDPEVLLPYAGGDTDAALQCGLVIQRQMVQDPQLINLYAKILHPGLIAFEKVERRGVLVDVQRYLALERELQEAIVSTTREIMSMIPMQIKAKFSDNLKLSRSALLLDFLFDSVYGLRLKPSVFALKAKYGANHPKAGEPVPSTSIDDHLGTFRTHPKAGPFIIAMERLNSAKKTLQTYVCTRDAQGTIKKGFLAHLRPDRRFHPTYVLHTGALFDNDDKAGGTVTGRLSAKDPAIQTLPKHTTWATKLREAYIAPPGMVCWQLDFSQGELRVAACIANEHVMIQSYLDGIDLHAVTASQVNGISVDEMLALKIENNDRYKELRQGGKAGNFGKIYGMGAGGFVDYAWKSYGVLMTHSESEDFHEAFFTLYPALLPWHAAAKAHARAHGHVRSPLGRIRHLPLIKSSDQETRAKSERQSINSVVQGVLSDLCVDGVALIEQWVEENDAEDIGHTVGSTHDSIYGYVQEEHAEQVVGIWQQLINSRSEGGANSYLAQTFGWQHQLPFPVDAEIGLTMADLKEVQLTP